MDELQDPPQTQKNVSNKELKTIVIDLGADLVDTLDSIHNAILATRNQISALKKRMDDYRRINNADTSEVEHFLTHNAIPATPAYYATPAIPHAKPRVVSKRGRTEE